MIMHLMSSAFEYSADLVKSRTENRWANEKAVVRTVNYLQTCLSDIMMTPESFIVIASALLQTVEATKRSLF